MLVGAGPTGVEMSGSISEMTRALLPSYHHLRRDQVRIILVDALPRILNSFPEDLAQRTQHKLQSMGIEVQLGKKVQQVDGDGVTVQAKDAPEERIRSRVVLWTAGVVGSSAGQWVGAEVDRDNRVKVNPDFSIPGHDDIFAIGDTAFLLNKPRDFFGKVEDKERPLPGVAQPAMQAGQYVAKLIRRRVRGLPPPPPFQYFDKGDLAQVSKGFAVADLKILKFTGVFAWLLWLGIHIFYLIGFANRLLTLVQWGSTILTTQRGVRDFAADHRPARPRSRRRRLPRRQVTPARGTIRGGGKRAMTTVAILPVPTEKGSLSYRGIAGDNLFGGQHTGRGFGCVGASTWRRCGRACARRRPAAAPVGTHGAVAHSAGTRMAVSRRSSRPNLMRLSGWNCWHPRTARPWLPMN